MVNILIGFNLSLNIMIGCPAQSKILLHFLLFTKIPLINFIIAACTHATLSTGTALHSYRIVGISEFRYIATDCPHL